MENETLLMCNKVLHPERPASLDLKEFKSGMHMAKLLVLGGNLHFLTLVKKRSAWAL